MRLSSVSRDDGGAIAIVVAVFAVVAFGFAAIVVDLGYARSLKARAQDAADSAALAAAAVLYESGDADFAAAVNAAKDNAREVLGSAPGAAWETAWLSCDDSLPLPVEVTPCVSFDAIEEEDPRRVRVIVPVVPETEAESFFGGIFGYDGIDISASAVASLGPVEFTPECAICVLGPGPHVLSDADVAAQAADIFFSGDVDLVNGSTVAAVGRTLFVRESLDVDPLSTVDAAIVSPTDSIDVPLDGELPLPSVGTKTGNPCDPLTGGPGVYSGDVVLSNVLGACELTLGTYVFSGAITADTDAVIVGIGVQLQLQAGASIDFSEAAVVTLTGPTLGSLIFADDGDSVTIDLFGADVINIRGDVNAPSGTLIGGPGSLPCPRSTVDGLLVVSELDVDGACVRSVEPTVRTVVAPDPPVLIR